MLWLDDPKFVRVRDNILDALKRNEYRFRRTPNVLFLCGANQSRRRDLLSQYIRKRRADTLVFYAEEIWTALSRIENLSALEMEAKLAELSDIVVIIVESPGTFAELGAFSLSTELRKKLLPILDEKYRTGQSFVETGPVCWIDRDSDFRPSIWVNHETILEAVPELETRLNEILPDPPRVEDLSGSQKHLLFFLCDMVAIFGPCPSTHVAYYLERILGQKGGSPEMLLRLGCAMQLLATVVSPQKVEMFYRPTNEGTLKVYHYTKKHLGIPSLRAEVMSVMQRIPSATAAICLMEEKACS